MLNNYQKYFKPFFDFIVSFLLLILALPIMLVIGSVLFFTNKGNILFYQKRSGINHKIFLLYKFRTLDDGFIEDDSKNANKNFGWFLRTSSLDELPQLINIMKGEMSLVGPRPLLPEYKALYNENHYRRFSVKPGLTGLVQVFGRHKLTWTEKLDLDIEYVDKVGIWIDLKIILKTFTAVLRWKEASSLGRFRGYD